MLYAASLTIPPNTTANLPAEAKLTLPRGLIYKVEIQFPAGCSGLAHVQVFDGSFQIYPANPEETFACDDYTISFEDRYLVGAKPGVLKMYGYNEDDTYEHTIQLRVGLVSEDILIASYLPGVKYDEMIEKLGDLVRSCEERKSSGALKPFSLILT